MIETIKTEKQCIWFDSDIIDASDAAIFDANYWQANNKVVGSAKGRGTTWFVQLDSIQGALRHYRRGGLFGKLVEDNYWFSGWDKTRSAAEFSLLLSLREAGVNVPKPIAARAVKSGLTYQADLLSERIPQARDLVSILQEKPLPAEIYQRIGLEIRKMHDVGVNHTDLNIHNILLDKQDKVWIIDFDKCQKLEGDTWKQANWDRLKRSFIKEKAKVGIHWDESNFELLATNR
ncbi:3-deoxy-D-manno-octulosonic-acid kinase [Vibrio ichthyoenteri ATCC 700023]|uniref:3-deoxy-D-manno-octulosonic acid kinase n=1 Tax=Vibrio ichthyoenteri ATCC 700023 TaxID=870968 RepID=F9S4L5_9VIBR|nr:3-deoxy-D-manno-octulosonic acid kinase [Vibrio ichthyoenteri]EGU36705.1 3-deoxy-D-manno-octulosonic-acid kinase [Vibrio ichthyoenteri ATCC 700023]